MTKLKLDVSISLDGYLAGPDQTLESRSAATASSARVGRRGASFRSSHGMEGGERGIDDQLATETPTWS